MHETKVWGMDLERMHADFPVVSCTTICAMIKLILMIKREGSYKLPVST